jgi:RNA polymerase sigma-70 factor (ECF subfamily)
MKSVAMNLLGNATDAEDAVQEAFLRIYRKASGFRGGSSFSTWTYRVLVNACYDLLRRRRGRPAQDSAETLQEVPAPASDQALRLSLQRAIERLRERHRAVFVLFEVEGFSHREIAGVLGVSEGNSRSLLFEAKRELQRLLFPSARMGAAAS